jgi:branched-chain amino acid transport system substrate-binding protein
MPVFGGPAMGRRLFVERAGPAAEGVVFPLLWYPSSAGRRSTEFAMRFRERFGVEPDYTAAHTYDAMTLLVAAIHQAGLNRVRIRDTLRLLSPWSGVTGLVTWDPTGHNHRPIQLGTIRNGRIVPQ